MITLRTNTRFAEVERLVDRLAQPAQRYQRQITDGLREQFAANFTRQASGAGRWAPLRPQTIAQRRELGFGERPILVRSGRYRASFTQRSAPDHYERIQPTGVGLLYEVGSDDARGADLERGTRRMPARPVTLLDENQTDRLVRLIDAVVTTVERQFWR